MNVWVVRGGREGEFEEFALQEGVAVIDFGLRRSVSDFTDKNDLIECLYREPRYEDLTKPKVTSAASQLWRFANEIHSGDMVLMPRKSPKVVAVGRVASDYHFRSDLTDVGCHTRKVDWRAVDIPRVNFDQDLLYSITGQLTLFQVKKDNAASRIDQIANAHLAGKPVIESEAPIDIPDDDTPDSNLDEQIEDRIVRRIREKFSGLRLERLVAAILRSSGYEALETRSGPDGGVDVLAGRGDMGFGEPRLCVQVKSGSSPVGLPDYNRLQGNIQGFGAQHGLLVSLSDFTSVVRKENERSFFQIRLWGPHELVDSLLETYDSLPADIRADIPLQSRRVLVESEE